MRIYNCFISTLFLEAISSFLFIFFITLSSNTHSTSDNILIDKVSSKNAANNESQYIDRHDSLSQTPPVDNIEAKKTPKLQPNNLLELNVLIGSLLFGLSLSMGIQVNPACSFAQWLTNPNGMQSNAVLSWVFSLFAQYLGGILACLLCYKFFGHTFQFNPPSTYAALVSEIFGTFFLVLVLLHFKTYFDNTKKTLTIHFVETVTIAWISFAFMAASSGCLNPALASCSFYAMIYFNGFTLHPAASAASSVQWIKMTPYYIGPYIGSLLASLAYRSMVDSVDESMKPLLDKTSRKVIGSTVDFPSDEFYVLENIFLDKTGYSNFIN